MNKKDDKNIGKKVLSKFSTKLFLISLTILAIVIVSLSVDFKFELMQYKEIGEQYINNLWTNAYASIISMIASFVFIFLCIFITNIIIIKKIKHFFIEENVKPIRLPNYSLAFIIAIVGAVLSKDFLYQNALVFLKAFWFSASDPVFGKDFSYYMFQRPFIVAVSDYISGTWMVVVLYSIAYYILAFGSLFNAVDIDSVKKYGVFNHNMTNIAIFFLIRTLTFNLDAERVLYSKNSVFFGAGYTDVNIWLKVYAIAPFILAAIVIMAFIFLARNKIKKAIITILLFPAFWVLSLIVAIAVQLIIVMPNEMTREKNYIKNSIDLTRYAYNISDKLEEKNFYVSDSLSSKMLESNQVTLSNLPIVDKTTTEEALKQLQEFRNYYGFPDVDIIKSNINGKTTAVYSSARELEKKGIDDKSYTNIRFRFTHGYGAVLNPVNAVDSQGKPDFAVKDIPVLASIGTQTIKKPQIYFGEMTKDHIIVNVKNTNEIDYPKEDTYKENVYNGKAGITLTPMNRILMSLKLGDPRLLISSSIDSKSKVLINRDVVARAKLIAPFLDIDKDPYIVVNSEGKMLWMLDGYTESSYFPYSKPVTLEKNRQVNYIRNSVKIVIDAYDGTIKFYIIDRTDPIIRTYEKIYPKMFEAGPIPSEIADQIKYPEKMFAIQAEILKRYHVSDVTQFTNAEDIWSISVQQGKDKNSIVEPYYRLIKYPDAPKPELTLMLPYTQVNRNNLSGWVTVRSNAYNYGKMTLYKMPSNSLVYGPSQIESFIDQDPEYLKNANIWNQGDSSIIRGRLIILPLEDETGSTLLYIEPIYTSANKGISVPQLKKVAAFYQGKVVIGDTLEKVLQKLISSMPDQISTAPNSIDNKALIDKLISVYGEMKDFSTSNDWEGFGRKMKELDSIVVELNKRKVEIK